MANTVVIRATRAGYGYWADLEVEYRWTGNRFYVDTKRYRAAKNDRTSGNLKVGLVSGAGNTGWMALISNGNQNGEWHAFVRNLSVEGDGRSGTIYFNWIYDRPKEDDVNMTGEVNVSA
ncbi:hypothetical protein [Pseudomonas sp. 43mfcvi1.1]|jgi:hypothetical protein|uniref:hypothetical protein n=1 Tax=Pseudomonas sp. 43mfcvi1.1 TaxID=1761894 RepID=UPI0011B25A4B|nr:hypothetical protein [Pseudomonas sp. 43mfcvi1.1]